MILNVVGTRPNLIKIAPLIDELDRYSNIKQFLIHTGQHYDDKMSQIFFEELNIPQPDIYLGVGSGSHAVQTARIMIEFEKVLLQYKPDLVVVVGDVNSTLACSVTAAKLSIPVAHVEAGLRSFDRKMPEEINRIVTDALADYLFTPSRDAGQNLQREGIPSDKIFFVGNVMIDTLNKHRDLAQTLNVPAVFGQEPGGYALLTLHRPSNVDDPRVLESLVNTFVAIQQEIPILFPVHPRTKKRLQEFGLLTKISDAPNLQLIEPLGYLSFLNLMIHAQFVLTDSGGIQEETTILGIPCLTLRENTERPVTVTEGTNTIVGVNPERIIEAVLQIISGNRKTGKIPELWDGHAAKRIVTILQELLQD